MTGAPAPSASAEGAAAEAEYDSVDGASALPDIIPSAPKQQPARKLLSVADIHQAAAAMRFPFSPGNTPERIVLNAGDQSVRACTVFKLIEYLTYPLCGSPALYGALPIDARDF